MIVVVVFVLSPTSVYVDVVLIVRHALQLVMPAHTAILISTADNKINFLILVSFLFIYVIDSEQRARKGRDLAEAH